MSETVSTEIAQSGCKDNENNYSCKQVFFFYSLWINDVRVIYLHHCLVSLHSQNKDFNESI